jgi:hypothetical protein
MNDPGKLPPAEFAAPGRMYEAERRPLAAPTDPSARNFPDTSPNLPPTEDEAALTSVTRASEAAVADALAPIMDVEASLAALKRGLPKPPRRDSERLRFVALRPGGAPAAPTSTRS